MNQKWAEGQLTKYPEGRQASAVIPLLVARARARGLDFQTARLKRIADMLGMAYIRVLGSGDILLYVPTATRWFCCAYSGLVYNILHDL